MEYNYAQIDNNFADYIINLIGPSSERDESRENKFKSIKKIILKSFQDQNIIPHIFSFGSFPMRTYLPDSDIDITIILEDKNSKAIMTNYTYDYLNKILFSIQNSLETFNLEIGYQIISEINLIQADVKLIKCKYENLSFDISINNFVGLWKINFMNYVEKNVENNTLFKRSLFLIKAWSYYEGSILGSNIGLLASYALEILVIFLFNNFYSQINTEIDALLIFFKTMNEIDWDKKIITIYGYVNSDSFYVKLKNSEFNVETILTDLVIQNKNKNNFIKYEDILNLSKFCEKFSDLDKIQNFSSNKKAINLKFVNIIDPLFGTNNLGKSVNYHNFSKIKKVFELVTIEVNNFSKLKNQKNIAPIEYLSFLLKLFNRIVTMNNPDLFFMSLSVPKIMFNFKDDKSNLPIEKKIHNNEITSFNESFMVKKEKEKESENEKENKLSNLIQQFNKKFLLNDRTEKNENLM